MTGCDGSKEGNEENQENVAAKRRKEREAELYDMFYLFDKDRNGFITSKELGDIMMQFGSLNEAEVNIMLADADIDHDGLVTLYRIISHILYYSALSGYQL